MAYASQSGRAFADASCPSAFGVCDRCGFWNQLYKLDYQFQYAGPGLVNLGILVCDRCLDVPSEFLRSIVIPPDPVPVKNPRPEFFAADEGPPPAAEPVYLLVPD